MRRHLLNHRTTGCNIRITLALIRWDTIDVMNIDTLWLTLTLARYNANVSKLMGNYGPRTVALKLQLPVLSFYQTSSFIMTALGMSCLGWVRLLCLPSKRILLSVDSNFKISGKSNILGIWNLVSSNAIISKSISRLFQTNDKPCVLLAKPEVGCWVTNGTWNNHFYDTDSFNFEGGSMRHYPENVTS